MSLPNDHVKKAKQSPEAKPSRDARRQSLIDAAKTQFSSKGYHASTVDDITRAAGVAKGTFYLYFAEKREIYYEVIRSFMNLIKDIGGSVGTSSDPLEFFASTERAALQLMTIFLENRKLARLAYRESMGLDPELEKMIQDFYREIANVEAENIKRAMKLGMIRDVNPLLVAYAHIGMVERVLMALVDHPDEFLEPKAVVRELMRLSWEGIKLPNGPTPF